MASESAATTAQSFYEAMGRGDIPAALGVLSPDIVWHEAEGNPLAAGNPYVGPQAVLGGVFAELAAQIDGFRVEVGEILPAGDKAVMLGRYRGVSKASGDALNAQVVHVWTVADGKLATFQQYTDTLQWTALLAAR